MIHKRRIIKLSAIILSAIILSTNVAAFYEWELKLVTNAWLDHKSSLQINDISQQQIIDFVQSNTYLLDQRDYDDAKDVPLYAIMQAIAEQEGLQLVLSIADFKMIELTMSMKIAIRRANESRFMSMEFARLLHDYHLAQTVAKKKEYEDAQTQKRKEIEADIAEFHERMLSLREAQDQIHRDIALADEHYRQRVTAIEDERQALRAAAQKQNAANSKRGNDRNLSTKNRLKAKLANKNQEEILTLRLEVAEAEHVQILANYNFSLAMLKNLLDIVVDNIASHTMRLKQNDKPYQPKKFSAKGEFIKLSGCMPFLSIFQKSMDETYLFETLDSIAKDLFITPDYFANLDDVFLEQQKLLSEQALQTVKNPANFKDGDGISPEHIKNVINLLLQIRELHLFEKAKRLVASDTAMQTTIMQAPQSLFQNEPQPACETSQKTSSINWEVIVHPRVLDMKDRIYQGSMVDELAAYMSVHGPYIKRDRDSDRRWRNFDSLGKNVFHCHLGTSNTVVAWNVDKDLNRIHIFFLGDHPSTYKRILK